MSLDSAIPISCKSQKFSQMESIYSIYSCYFYLCMCRNSVIGSYLMYLTGSQNLAYIWYIMSKVYGFFSKRWFTLIFYYNNTAASSNKHGTGY